MALTSGASILMDFPEPSGRDAAADGSVVGRSSLRRRSMMCLLRRGGRARMGVMWRDTVTGGN